MTINTMYQFGTPLTKKQKIKPSRENNIAVNSLFFLLNRATIYPEKKKVNSVPMSCIKSRSLGKFPDSGMIIPNEIVIMVIIKTVKNDTTIAINPPRKKPLISNFIFNDYR